MQRLVGAHLATYIAQDRIPGLSVLFQFGVQDPRWTPHSVMIAVIALQLAGTEFAAQATRIVHPRLSISNQTSNVLSLVQTILEALGKPEQKDVLFGLIAMIPQARTFTAFSSLMRPIALLVGALDGFTCWLEPAVLRRPCRS
jgi:hypothetical protein